MEEVEITSARSFRLNNFDLLRLLAATQVIVDHYYQHLNIPISSFGLKLLYLFPGVPVFFVISGYLISASYERNNNLGVYAKNRALRIYPGLWGCILVTVIVIALTGISFFNKQTVAWLPAQLVGFIYTPAFLANYGFGSYNGSLWTIPIELQFYIMLPVCYLLARRKEIFKYLLYILLVVFIILNIFCTVSDFGPKINKLITYTFVPNFYMFLAGVILQRLQLYKSTWIHNKALYWAAGYVAFSLLLQEHMSLTAFLIIKNLLLAFVVLSLAYSLPQLAGKLLRSNDISYGVYIYHGLVLTVIVQEKLAGRINLFEIILISYLLGLLSWWFVEKPFLKKKAKSIRAIE
jgi:peptidoglycan/LPS O-acetylase OafA/YrhL